MLILCQQNRYFRLQIKNSVKLDRLSMQFYKNSFKMSCIVNLVIWPLASLEIHYVSRLLCVVLHCMICSFHVSQLITYIFIIICRKRQHNMKRK